MGEAKLAHDSKSLIPSLKWLETDLSDAVGRLQGLPTFRDIQQEGTVLQRKRLAGRGQSHCAIGRVPTVKLWRLSNDPLSTIGELGGTPKPPAGTNPCNSSWGLGLGVQSLKGIHRSGHPRRCGGRTSLLTPSAVESSDGLSGGREMAGVGLHCPRSWATHRLQLSGGIVGRSRCAVVETVQRLPR